jgi:hypothetical protein
VVPKKNLDVQFVHTLIERPYSRTAQTVGAVYDRRAFFVRSSFAAVTCGHFSADRPIESVLDQDIVARSSIKDVLPGPTDQNVIAVAAE